MRINVKAVAISLAITLWQLSFWFCVAAFLEDGCNGTTTQGGTLAGWYLVGHVALFMTAGVYSALTARNDK